MIRTLALGTLTVIAAVATIAAAAEQRDWKDTSGRFSISAELVEVLGETVQLRKAGGTEVSVALDRLCVADQEYVREQMPAAADSKPLRSSEKTTDSVRVWKDESGEFSLEAELVDQSGKEVRLRKKDGSMVTVPIDRLGAEDLAFLRKKKGGKGAQRGPIGVECILQGLTSVDFASIPLSEAVDQLQKQNGLKIFIDARLNSGRRTSMDRASHTMPQISDWTWCFTRCWNLTTSGSMSVPMRCL